MQARQGAAAWAPPSALCWIIIKEKASWNPSKTSRSQDHVPKVPPASNTNLISRSHGCTWAGMEMWTRPLGDAPTSTTMGIWTQLVVGECIVPNTQGCDCCASGNSFLLQNDWSCGASTTKKDERLKRASGNSDGPIHVWGCGLKPDSSSELLVNLQEVGGQTKKTEILKKNTSKYWLCKKYKKNLGRWSGCWQTARGLNLTLQIWSLQKLNGIVQKMTLKTLKCL